MDVTQAVPDAGATRCPRDTILHGDALSLLRTLPSESVQCCVTSPPYWSLRDYGTPGQLGLEATPDEYAARMVEVFREVKRVLRNDGTCWVNMGDGYAASGSQTSTSNTEGDGGRFWHTEGHEEHFRSKKYTGQKNPASAVGGLKPKDLIGMPWRLAFALQADGWYLRADIIWAKKNAMPESVSDRPTKAHEYLFLLSKRASYYYDADAIREEHVTLGLASTFAGRGKSWHDHKDDEVQGDRRDAAHNGKYGNPAGRNKRSVWTVATAPFAQAHFATFPPKLIEPCVLAGAPAGGLVLDPFMGAGTVGVVCRRHSRHYLGIELNAAYIAMAETRIASEVQPVLWTAQEAG